MLNWTELLYLLPDGATVCTETSSTSIASQSLHTTAPGGSTHRCRWPSGWHATESIVPKVIYHVFLFQFFNWIECLSIYTTTSMQVRSIVYRFLRLHSLVEGTIKAKKNLALTDIADWTGIGITTCEREAEDWQKWRKIVKSSKCRNGR